jgi:hypothetical protein
MRPGFQCIAFAKLLAHAAHRGNTGAGKLRGLPRGLAAFVKLQNTLADDSGNGLHGQSLPQPQPIACYIIYENALIRRYVSSFVCCLCR